MTARLWWLYGHTYDGLLRFWPYTHLLDEVTDYLKPQPGDRILELGCGTGNVLQRVLTTSRVTVTGVDLSSSMLGVARRKLRVEIGDGQAELIQADLSDWLTSQPDHSYDAIVSVNVLYAIDDQAELWRELLRVVKPGGRIVATTSVRPGSWPIIKEHLAHASWWRPVTPRLIGVFIIDAFINLLGRVGTFGFSDEANLRRHVAAAGGRWDDRGYCYGGPEKGVNILFRVRPE